MKVVKFLKDNGNKNAGEIATCEDDELDRLVKLKIVEEVAPRAPQMGEHRAVLPPGGGKGGK